ncbi:MAG: carbohydrate ABC transporter permease [Bacilli bacterium]|jgi:ABC transporter, permease protein|nr:carbohydrate ABC transporter permease [Staphylococcus sp.]
MTTKNKKKELKKEHSLEELTPTVEKTEIVDETRWTKIRKISKDKYNEIVMDLKNPIKRAVMRRKTSTKLMAILRGFIFIGLSFVIVFPIFQEFSLAFRHPVDLNNKLVNWIPETFSLFNFRLSKVLLDYWHGLWCNLKVSTISTICQLIATSLAGYAFSRLKFRGSNIIFWLIMLTLIVPPQAISLARTFFLDDFDILRFNFFGLFDNPGLFESLLGHGLRLKGEGKDIVFYITSLTGQGIRAALFIYLFRQFFRGIPIELEESAQIDGAGVVRTFWSVMLPNARGVITTVALFAFVWQWNDTYYTGMYQISGESFPMLTRKLISMSERIDGIINQPQYQDFLKQVGEGISKNPLFVQVILNTAALMLMAPLIIGYLFVQRLFIEGVERSGIVG